MLVRQGKIEDAKVVLRKSILDTEDKLVLAELESKDNPRNALALLDEVSSAADFDTTRKEHALSLRIEILLDAQESAIEDGVGVAFSLVEEYQTIHGDSVIVQVLRSRIANASGDQESAVSHLASAKQILSDKSSFADRFMLAREFDTYGSYRDCADVLIGHVDPTQDSPPLQLLLDSLVRSERRREARELLDSLPLRIAQHAKYRFAALSIHYRRGDYSSAEAILDQLIEDTPNDLGLHIRRIEIGTRQSKKKEIKALLSSQVETMDGSAQDRIHLAHLLNEFGFGERSLRLAYATLFQNPTDLVVRNGYVALLMPPKAPHIDNPFPIVVIENAAAVIQDRGGALRTLIIEPNTNLQSGSWSVLPKHPLAIQALGKSVGDTIATSGGDWTIRSIKSKYIHALHEALENLDVEEPDTAVARRIPLGEDEAKAQEAILGLVRARHERGEYILQLYAEQPLPIEFVAKLLGDPVIDVWGRIANTDVAFRSCLGTNDE